VTSCRSTSLRKIGVTQTSILLTQTLNVRLSCYANLLSSFEISNRDMLNETHDLTTTILRTAYMGSPTTQSKMRSGEGWGNVQTMYLPLTMSCMSREVAWASRGRNYPTELDVRPLCIKAAA
jgi:hypothetical protein